MGVSEYVYQTCYGISKQAIAAIIATHGNNLGLKLPPIAAPIQAVIIHYFQRKREYHCGKL